METTTVNGMAYGAVQSITVGASPFTWANPEQVRVYIAISVGTITDVSLSLDSAAFVSTGILGGCYVLNPGQAVKVTYVLTPTMKYWPI